MRYYHVWVRSNRYRGKRPLTYSSSEKIAVGSLVRVPLQRESVLGFVSEETAAPKGVKLKSISQVLELPPLPSPLLKSAAWLQSYYRASIGSVAQVVIPTSIPQKLLALQGFDEALPDPGLPPLTAAQATALKQLRGSESAILHGRTGSGKTRLYQELTATELAAGRSVLILSPEISLTSQLARAFEVFGTERVVILHSNMTNAERFKAWRKIAGSQAPLIIIGARSALFSPVKNLGLIVVDEVHENAYKQEQEPRYHAVRLASVLAASSSARLIFGSATPSVVDYYLAQQKNRPIVRLTELAKAGEYQTTVTVVDLKDRSHFGRSSILSDELLASVTASFAAGEQSLLYLNRRGTARLSLCQNCGWQAACPNCDLPLTYHGDAHRLRCHVCSFSASPPTTCPECGHTDIVFRSIGTKAVVSEVERLFPDARIMRFDSDNSKEERFEERYAAVMRGEADILIGTQTLAKGLDLPLLSTLGVITADTSLQMPDYTAGERTYQLLAQVLGRIQRGHRDSRAIIQTYDPEGSLLQAALSDDWERFYTTELTERKLFRYPPYSFLLKITCRRASARSAEQACQKIKDSILAAHRGVIVDGPAPALHERFKETYTWQIIVKAVSRARLLVIVDDLPSTVTSYDLDPLDLL